MAIDRGYRLSPAADRDLANIWRYTARRWSLGQAERYQDELASAFAGPAAGRKAGRPVEIGHGVYLKYAVGAHSIYFRETGDEIIVVRVLHSRQDAGRHLHP
mgnify:CR=1 FL=1